MQQGPMGPMGQPTMQSMPMELVPQGHTMMGPQIGPGQMVGPPGPMGPPMGGPNDQPPMVSGMITANGYLPGGPESDPHQIQIMQQQQPEWT